MKISFVVDAIDLHYYQAELLLYSLEEIGFLKENIIVQCVNRVPKHFLDFLLENAYLFNIIEPYLDGKYCNKLQQLNYFCSNQEDVLLLDTDTFVLDDLEYFRGESIMGKVVDAPNPNLNVLKNIFKEANIDIKYIKSDWDLASNETANANCNGGVYFIPAKYIETLNHGWKKWAEFLYNRTDLFENDAQIIHVDQISFALAINEKQLAFKYLNANSNCPIHQKNKLSSLDYTKPISLIHYHRELDEFGYINNSSIDNVFINSYITKANKQIKNKKNTKYFSNYKKSSIKIEIYKIEKLATLLDDFKKKFSFVQTIVLHYGTPKTGTTSLQFSLDDNRENLIKNGIYYPEEYIGTYAPKHQWLVDIFMHKKYELFENYLYKIFNDAEKYQCEKIVLSTEGLYNHWWDYPFESKMYLFTLSKYYNLKHVIFLRSPQGFLKSLYQQYMKNPQIDMVECYGKALTLDEMMKDKWFIKHFDYIGFLTELENFFGANNVVIKPFSKNIVKDFYDYLDSVPKELNERNENTSLNLKSVELLYELNKLIIPPDEKELIVEYLLKMNKILKKYDEREIVGMKQLDKINTLMKFQLMVLKDKYNCILIL